MQRMVLTALVACIGLGSSPFADAAGLSATGKVIAVLAGELFVGEAKGYLNGSGTLSIQSEANPSLTCAGRFTSTAALGGAGQMLCNDGVTATFRFQRLSVFRGYGTGKTSRGEMSFAYGFSAAEAAPYLKLPEGKKLANSGAKLALVDQ
jgi:hypothetical protein